ncbi:uncharacterized protein STEHIDRAFT_149463 [Stereum hirsutum FP-91666 SS1]|uniref:uncharacterized protein n=1 Tax=Stereum hirsutum (strain FP-91666) TaxID=721885 RepID=UPI000444A392|nr:uncharacterized protein STEHIDRAFT_149463 [Stereum hirsutum FP-91666 SS1]EIM82348.1 hypothetical protein STEHIDRAFT_149463 [Stereum hirsutum FP-91666 SS1]
MVVLSSFDTDLPVIDGQTGQMTRAAYDQEILKAKAQIAHLLLMRNSMAPISSLPNETLSTIFLYYATVVEKSTSGRWTQLMLVCRRWRVICLGDARLWSFVTPDRQGRFGRIPRPALPLEVRLRRSAEIPLTCRFDLSRATAESLATVLSNHGQRIRTLSVTGATNRLQTAFQGITDLPSLVDLNIAWNGHSMRERHWVIPAEFVEANAPHLQSISLHDVEFFSWPSLNDLTSLELCNYQGQDGFRPPLEDVLSLLQRSPRLTNLKLHHCWQENGVPLVTFTNESILLPNLGMLDLSGGTSCLTVILRTLDIPASTSMHFCLSDAWLPSSLLPFLIPLRRTLARTGVPTLRSVCVEGGRDLFYAFSAHTTEDCPGTFQDPRSAHLSIQVQPEHARHVEAMFAKLIRALPLEPSQTPQLTLTAHLRPNEIYANPTRTWAAIFQLLPQTNQIVVDVDTGLPSMLEGLLTAMQRGTRGISGRRRRRIIRTTVLQPSTIILQPPVYPASLAIHYQPQVTTAYEGLVGWLEKYKETEGATGGNIKGETWDVIELKAARNKIEIPDADLEPYKSRIKELTKKVGWVIQPEEGGVATFRELSE